MGHGTSAGCAIAIAIATGLAAKTLSPLGRGVAARWLAGWLRPALVLVAGWLSLAGWLPKSGLLYVTEYQKGLSISNAQTPRGPKAPGTDRITAVAIPTYGPAGGYFNTVSHR